MGTDFEELLRKLAHHIQILADTLSVWGDAQKGEAKHLTELWIDILNRFSLHGQMIQKRNSISRSDMVYVEVHVSIDQDDWEGMLVIGYEISLSDIG